MSTLIDLRTEVANHGFDPNQYLARINTYLNDAMRSIARKIHYYQDEATQAITTVQGQKNYPWPTDFGKARDVSNPDRGRALRLVRLRDLDDSPQGATGTPYFYAVEGATMRLYPTPDNVYSLVMRYWSLPALMVADTDVPGLPLDYHHILSFYALQRCYENEDALDAAQYWQGQWTAALKDMATDVKFPSSDGPRQVAGMWNDGDGLLYRPWSLP